MSFHYHRDILPSGLRVVTVEAPHLSSAVVSVYVRAGSRHETARTNGVSHYLEHMFFRGSEHYPDTVKMNAVVEDVGGNLNGVTTRDHGFYYTPLHPDHLAVGLDVLGDMLLRPRFVELEVERQVILEEMLDEVDEDGRDIDVDNLSKMQLFAGHPLALKIAGTPESVKGITLADIEAHFHAHYVAENLVVTAAGKVNRAEVLDRVQRAFGALPHGAVSKEAPPPAAPVGPWFQTVRHDESQTELRMLFPTVPEPHPDFTVLQLVRRVLDDGLSSRLPYHVVEKLGLAYSVHASMDTYTDIGLFEIDAACTPEKGAALIGAIFEVLGRLAENGATEEELVRAQRRNSIFLDFAQDSPGDLAAWFGGTELFRIPETFAERKAEVNRVTLADVKRVVRTYLTAKNLGVTAVGPAKGVAALEKRVLEARGNF